jgi:succinate dehydrogenase / fumarate reductase, membrane anchor subunit
MSGQASGGLRAWVVQRISAVYLALCFTTVLILWLTQRPVTYDAWRAWIAHPVVNIAAVLFFIALALHAWVGVRDVVIDYVHATAARFALLVGITASLLVMLVWAFRILLLVPLS